MDDLIRFTCPCGQASIRVASKAAGRTGPCPKCGQPIRVPTLEEIASSSTPSNTVTPQTDQPAKASRKPLTTTAGSSRPTATKQQRVPSPKPPIQSDFEHRENQNASESEEPNEQKFSGYIASHLSPGEQLLLLRRPHWSIWIGPVIATMLLGIVACILVLGFEQNILQFLGYGIFALLTINILATLIKWYTTEYGITTNRVIVKIATMLLGMVACILVLGSEQNILQFLGYGIFALLTINLLATLIKWYTTEYGITTKRVIVKKGLIIRNVREIRLTKVGFADFDQGVLGRMLNFGDMVFSGTGQGVLVVPRIASPIQFKDAVLNAKEG